MRRFLIALAVTALAAGCGKGAPAAPSNSGSSTTTTGATPVPGSGATISGSLQGSAATGQSVRGGPAITGVTVTIVGTSISISVDASGHFTFTNVPPGDVQLQFSGAATGSLTVSAVGATETVDLVITVSGGTTSVASEVRSGAAEAQLEGLIDALPPTTAPLTFTAVGKTVKTDSSTQFVDGGTTRAFTDLQLGMRVHVKGSLSGSVMTARWIELQSPQVGTPPTAPTPAPPEDTSASIQGTLKNMTGSKPNLTLTVDTTTVHTSSSTDVRRRGDTQTLDTLALGQTLHVVGTRNSDGSIDARLIEIVDDSTGGAFEIQGSVGGLKGTCPSLTFGINGFSISTSGLTSFQGGACSALKNGSKVTVDGTKNADGSVAATTVTFN
jgi:hypothetical protein